MELTTSSLLKSIGFEDKNIHLLFTFWALLALETVSVNKVLQNNNVKFFKKKGFDPNAFYITQFQE